MRADLLKLALAEVSGGETLGTSMGSEEDNIVGDVLSEGVSCK